MKRVYKLFWVWNYDKEEAWLNEMADKGYCLSGVGLGRYEFEKCEPGGYTLRMDFLEYAASNPKSKEYIARIENTGAELVDYVWKWAYFRKRRDLGEFQIYSDNSSHRSYLNRLILMLVVVGLVNLYLGVSGFLLAMKFNQPYALPNIFNFLVALLLGFAVIKLSIKSKNYDK